MHPDAHEPLREPVVDLAEQPVPLGSRRFHPCPLLSHFMHTGGSQGDRRMPGEQLQQLGVVRP